MPKKSARNPVASLAWSQALAWRVAQQHLRERLPRKRMLDVVRDLCGVRAQLSSSAELQLHARLDGLARTDIADALAWERSLVRLWGVRGTLHLIRSDEFGLWTAALSTHRHFERPSWSKAFGVSQDELRQLFDLVPQLLDGRALTRAELADEVAARTGSAALGETLRDSFGSVLKPLSLRGLLCFAPSDDQSPRLTSPKSWLPPWLQWEPEDALREVTRRYLRAYGPASREEYARWWAGISAAQAERRIEALADEVAIVEVDGERRWLLAEDVDALVALEPRHVVRLLPAFDQYVVTAPRHPALVDPTLAPRIYRPQAYLSPTLLIDGRLVGVWRHERAGDRLAVTIEPFAPLTSGDGRSAAREAERIAAFLGGALDLHGEL